MAIRAKFNPEHPEKYKGDLPIEVRSSWELDFARYCDLHPDVLQWSYEPHQIPYHDPISNRQKIYIPDFLVTFMNRGGEPSTKLIEIKPQKEAVTEHARNNKDALLTLKNDSKWTAAMSWAQRRGIDFIVMTEVEMYTGGANMRPRQRPLRPEKILAQVKKADPKKPRRIAKANQKKKDPLKGGIRSRVKRAGTISKVGRVGKSRRS